MKHGVERVKKYVVEYAKLMENGKINESSEIWTDEADFLRRFSKCDIFRIIELSYRFGYMVGLKEVSRCQDYRKE